LNLLIGPALRRACPVILCGCRSGLVLLLRRVLGRQVRTGLFHRVGAVAAQNRAQPLETGAQFTGASALDAGPRSGREALLEQICLRLLFRCGMAGKCTDQLRVDLFAQDFALPLFVFPRRSPVLCESEFGLRLGINGRVLTWAGAWPTQACRSCTSSTSVTWSHANAMR
jgi:hypothetical protein